MSSWKVMTNVLFKGKIKTLSKNEIKWLGMSLRRIHFGEELPTGDWEIGNYPADWQGGTSQKMFPLLPQHCRNKRMVGVAFDYAYGNR